MRTMKALWQLFGMAVILDFYGLRSISAGSCVLHFLQKQGCKMFTAGTQKCPAPRSGYVERVRRVMNGYRVYVINL